MEISGKGRRRAFRSRHRTPMGEGGKLALIVISAALVLFVLAVLLGTYLRNLTENDPYATDDATGGNTVALTPAAAVKARAIVFGVRYRSDETDFSVADTGEESSAEESTGGNTEITQKPESDVDYDAVSVVMRVKEDGGFRLAYSSPIGERYGFESVGVLTIGEGVAIIRNDWGEDCYISGIFEVGYLSDDESTRGITREYEAALLCELAGAGFDDIVLVGFENNAQEGVSFVKELTERTEGKTLFGLAFSFDFYNSGDAQETVREVSMGCGLLALDLYTPDIPKLMRPEDYVYDRVSRASDVIDRYAVRVLVDSESADILIKSAISAGAYSFGAVAPMAE